MSEQRKKLPRATLAQAKAAWEAHPAPSIRKVMDSLELAGLSCSLATMQRWRKAKFELKKRASRQTTAEQARAKVNKGIEQIEEKALTRIEQLEAEESEMRNLRDTLLTNSDSELARIAMRESLVAQILLSRQIQRRAVVIVELAPEKAPKMIEALKGPAASTTIVLPPGETSGQGDDAKVVQGRVIEESPTQLAIAAFKARQKQGVAA